MRIGARALLAMAAASLLAEPAAAGWWGSDEATTDIVRAPSGEVVSIEPSFGYLRGTSTEYVNNSSNPKQRVSRLDWDMDAATIGARVAVRPIDGLTVRGRFWAAVAAGSEMKDFDWLAGYSGANSWTHRSISPNTTVPKAWQGDISVAVNLVEADDVTLAGLAGFRQYNVKYRATGGSYIYSSKAFRDTVGTFPSNQLGISYEQWWSTPYFGIGAYYRGEDLALGAELTGSPYVIARDKDYHNLRSTVFKESFSPTGMVAISASAEYRLFGDIWLVGRFEYQRYVEASGKTKMLDGTTNTYQVIGGKAAGAEADAIQVTAGVKAKL